MMHLDKSSVKVKFGEIYVAKVGAVVTRLTRVAIVLQCILQLHLHLY